MLGQGSITLSNGPILGGGSIIGNSLFSENRSRNIKKVQMNETSVDILAVSCCWYRLRTNDSSSKILSQINSTITDSEFLFEQVNHDDHILAAKIRDYYSKKIMMWKLKEKTLSNFRSNLAEFISGSGQLWKEEFSGMIVKLPEFYFYDIKLEDIISTHFSREASKSESNTSKTLIPVGSLTRKTKSYHRTEYWFKTNDREEAVKFSIDHKNELKYIWEMLFNSNVPLTIQGNYVVSNLGDYDHYLLKPTNLINTISIQC
jgi:hypothetical protein